MVHPHFRIQIKGKCYLKKCNVDDYTQVEGAGCAAVDQLSLQAMLDQRPRDNNCRSLVCSKVQKCKGLTISASFDVTVRSRRLCKQHIRRVDVFQHW